jgi:hypothetical protein
MLKVDVDFSGMDGKLREIVKLTKEEPAKIMVQEARLLCVELAKYTQPFGLDDAAKKQGEEALARDYNRVYAQASAVFKELQIENKDMADGFWKAFQARQYDKASKILRDSKGLNRNTPIQPFDGGTAHNRRWKRGKVGGGVVASLILQVQKGLKPFLTKEKGKVGFAKGGWAACAKKLGGIRGIPAWIYKHDTPASVIDNTDKENPSITIRNEVNYTDQVLSATGAADALKDREIKLTERIKKILGSKFYALQSKE